MGSGTMNCTEYGPWVSRYVDEDLEGKELETFLDHLSECAACQKEVGGLEQLTGWLKAVDAFQGVPDIKGDWGLADLLEREEPSESVHRASEQGKKSPWSAGWIKRFLFPSPLPAQNLMRYALPLLVVAVVAAWFYKRKTGDWIDVRQLQPLSVATVALPEEEGHEMDFFVMQHSTHQPWAEHGDELPMIEFASGSSR
jgi:hypothetical protein